MRKDLQYVLRTLARSPGFAIAATLTLALGIGANTAIFSVVNAVLLKPLPFRDPNRLMMVWERNPQGNRTNVANPGNYVAWTSSNHVFEAMATFVPVQFNLAGDGDPEQIPGLLLTCDFFSTLGVPPIAGRTFTADECAPNAPNVVIIAHSLWQRRFGGDPSAVGRTIQVNNRANTIVGIMPQGFRVPNFKAEIWAPFDIQTQARLANGRFLTTIARLKSGISPAQAQADMDVIASRLQRERPDFDTNWGITVMPMHEWTEGDLRTPLLVLLAAVGIVLLIACANIAGMILMRATGRTQEIAIRVSLGAGRWRVVRQLLFESVTLACIGGALGVLLAVWVTRVLITFMPESISVQNVTNVGIDPTVFLFALVMSLLTGAGCGLFPAIRISRLDLSAGLKEGARAASASLGKNRIRAALVIAEIALSLMLLVGAGLMIRSLSRLQSVSPGFEPNHTLTLHLSLNGRPRKDVPQLLESVLDGIRTLPEVRAAGSAHFLPLSGRRSATGFWREGPKPAPSTEPVTEVSVVSSGYFSAMGVPLLKGRTFTARDRAGAPFVVIINSLLARQFFPNEDPLGRRLMIEWGRDVPYEIVGVVGDIRHTSLAKEPLTGLFLSALQEPSGTADVVIRTPGDPMSLARSVKAEIHRVDANLPVAGIRTLDSYVSDSVSQPRFNSILLASFAGLALVLAATGIFVVLSHSVVQRKQEIGLRMALGATQGDVLSLVLRQGLWLIAAGIVLGIAGALALTRFLKSLLFETSAMDPATFAAVATFLALVGVAAIFLPARRAAAVDPNVALRYE